MRRSSKTITLVLIASPLILSGCGPSYNDGNRPSSGGGGYHYYGGGGGAGRGGGAGIGSHGSPAGGFGGFGHAAGG